MDEVCAPEVLGDAALRLLGEARSGRGGKVAARRRKGRGLGARAADLLARTPLADRLVYDKAKGQVLTKTGGHYPAPLVALDVVRDGVKLPLERALELEAGAFAELVLSDTAAQPDGHLLHEERRRGAAPRRWRARRRRSAGRSGCSAPA